jgi:hypothetical protein
MALIGRIAYGTLLCLTLPLCAQHAEVGLPVYGTPMLAAAIGGARRAPVRDAIPPYTGANARNFFTDSATLPAT